MPYLVTVSGADPARAASTLRCALLSPAVAAWPLVGARSGRRRGTAGRLAGVDGTCSSGQRIRPGRRSVTAAATCTRSWRKGPGPPIRLEPTPFYFDFARARRRDIAIVWMARTAGRRHHLRDVEAIALSLAPGTPFLFMTSCGDIHPGWTPLERRLIVGGDDDS